MKKLLTTFALTALSTTLSYGGDWGKAPVEPSPIVELGCPCYTTGFEFSGFATGIFPDGGDDALGGGASLSYFFEENVGIETSYSVLDTSPSEKHVATVNLVYRFVDADACIAPYVMAGGGVLTNGTTTEIFDVGAGIDIRLESMGCVGIFLDGTYNWVGDGQDFALARAGFRIPF